MTPTSDADRRSRPPARCCAAPSPRSSRRSRADGDLDEAAFRRLVRWQILAGIDGLVPCGTTGESPTLSTDERERLIAATVEVAAERAVARPHPRRRRDRDQRHGGHDPGDPPRRRARRRCGARRGARTTTGPDSRMLEAHFRAVADEGDLPIVVYNVPSRTGTNVDADTFLRLAEHPRVVAVKEASGNLEQIARICRDRPRDVAVLAGDDAWTLPILALGGDGVVSVASNEVPGELVSPVRGRAWPATGRRRGGSTSAGCRSSSGNFRGGPNPVPVEGRPGD